MKRILVTGADGLVGSRFVEMFPEKKKFLTPSDRELDITNPKKVAKYISDNEINSVIHFAAYTDVGAAEDERGNKNGLCWRVNVEGTRNLLQVSNKKLHFIYISTDMVFSGSEEDPGPYEETHQPEEDSEKITWYGYSKLEAEKLVRAALGEKAAIVRLVYPVRARFEKKLDYLRKPLSLYDEGKLYPLFDDQQISISFIDEVSLLLQKLLESGQSGVFHAGSKDTTTPFELISHLLEMLRGEVEIKRTTLDGFIEKTGAPLVRYPKYGGLSVNMTEKRIGISFSSWKTIVKTLIQQGLK